PPAEPPSLSLPDAPPISDAAPRGVCRDCVADLAALRPHPTRPQPSPVGLPPCAALGDYDGALRGLILAYKERGRHPPARPLGRLDRKSTRLNSSHVKTSY